MRNLTKTIGLVAIVGAMATSCSGEKSPTMADGGAVKVETAVASRSATSNSRVYSGTVEESSSTSLSFPVGGTIASITVGAGDKVAKGQVIATLDQTTLENSYEIAKAALDEAQDAYGRMKQLHDANSLAEMKWVEVQNALRQAQSAEAIARKALNDGTIRAPFTGYISEKYLDAGMTAAPAIPVVKLVKITPAKVVISVPESEISSIGADQQAQIRVKALGDKTMTGKLTEKGISANPLSRNYDIKFEVGNSDGALLPGMICDVNMETGDGGDEIVVPSAVVLLDASNQNFVWLVKDGKAEKRVVDVAGFADNGLVIGDGISAGDTLIVGGVQKVSQGTRVVDSVNGESKEKSNH